MQRTAELYVNDLVTSALDLIRITSVDMPISGYDEEQAVKVLNKILTRMNGNGSVVPYFYDIEFNLTTGQDKYYIGTGDEADIEQKPFSDVAFVNLTYSEMLYPVGIITDAQALMTPKVIAQTFLPAKCRVYRENDANGDTYTVLHFLYAPDQAYLCSMRGKPYLDQINVASTIVDLPIYYRAFLELEMARRLVPIYGREDNWTTYLQAMYEEERDMLMATIEKDMDVQLSTALMPRMRYLWSTRLGVIT
jgi:hypothetical protein